MVINVAVDHLILLSYGDREKGLFMRKRHGTEKTSGFLNFELASV